MPQPLARRTLLTGGAAALAGCTGIPFVGSPPNRADFVVSNQTRNAIDYDIAVYRDDPDPFFEASDRVGPDGEYADDTDSGIVQYGNVIDEPGSYFLSVETSTGLSPEFRWDDAEEPAERRPDPDGITLTLYADDWRLKWVDRRVDS